MKEKIYHCIVMLLLVCSSFFLLPTTIFAEENTWEQSSEEQAVQEDLLEASGADNLLEQLPEETKNFLQEHQLNATDSKAILDLSGGDFIKIIWDSILQKMHEPFSVLAMVLGVVLLAALLGSLEDTFDRSGMSRMFQIVSVLCISSVLVAPIVLLIKETMRLIEQVSEFLLSFVPVYAGIIAVSGKPISAFAYNSLLLGVVELMSFVASTLLVPLCGIYLAFCLTGAVNDYVNIGTLAKSVKTTANWCLGFLVTIFVAILTIKSFVANSADSVTLSAGKYLAGSFIPVIGGVIGDALTVLQGSIGVIKSTVGAFGILSVLLCFLPGIINLLLMIFSVKIAQAVSEVFNVRRLSGLLEATGFVLNFMQSILICYGIMVIVSISLMLVLGLSI